MVGAELGRACLHFTNRTRHKVLIEFQPATRQSPCTTAVCALSSTKEDRAVVDDENANTTTHTAGHLRYVSCGARQKVAQMSDQQTISFQKNLLPTAATFSPVGCLVRLQLA